MIGHSQLEADAVQRWLIVEYGFKEFDGFERFARIPGFNCAVEHELQVVSTLGSERLGGDQAEAQAGCINKDFYIHSSYQLHPFIKLRIIPTNAKK